MNLQKRKLNNGEIWSYNYSQNGFIPQGSCKTLRNRGVNGELYITNIGHELTKEENQIWRDWAITYLLLKRV